MNFSPHFARIEFETHDRMPEECVFPYTALCVEFLEPVRAQFGPIIITSGYRSPEANVEAHGVKNSQHEATADYCAADWYVKDMQDLTPVFNWIRNNPRLQWDQLILEEGGLRSYIIHTSWSKTPRRMALVGETQNRSAYLPSSVVPYQVIPT